MAARNQTALNENAEVRILRRKKVEARTGLSRSTLYALIAANKFPKPIRLTGAQSVGWIESEVDSFLRERIAASRSASA